MAATKKKPAKRRVAKPAPKAPEPDPIRIEYVSLGSVHPAKQNAKAHVMEKIQDSMRRFGFVQPLTEDTATGRLVAGHGRLEALVAMHAAGEDAPSRIRQDGADWLVPVLRGVAFENEEEASAFCLADNKLSEIGGWDDAALTEILKAMPEAPRIAAGFSTTEVDALIAKVSGSESDDKSRAGKLRERFGVPPFTILDARQGYWQERKRAWLSLGIRSELGRVAPIGGLAIEGQRAPADRSNSERERESPRTRTRANSGRSKVSPGGSPRPACKTVGGKTVRGDGKGKRL